MAEALWSKGDCKEGGISREAKELESISAFSQKEKRLNGASGRDQVGFRLLGLTSAHSPCLCARFTGTSTLKVYPLNTPSPWCSASCPRRRRSPLHCGKSWTSTTSRWWDSSWTVRSTTVCFLLIFLDYKPLEMSRWQTGFMMIDLCLSFYQTWVFPHLKMGVYKDKCPVGPRLIIIEKTSSRCNNKPFHIDLPFHIQTHFASTLSMDQVKT